MEYLFIILGGIVVGVIVAAPIGPVNLICIRRTLAYGPLNGFFSGLGAAFGDGVFAVITAFSLTAATQWMEGYSTAIKLAGGIMLIGFGVHIFGAPVLDLRDEEGARIRDDGSSSLITSVVSTFALTITNPATLFGFAALFAGLSSLVETRPTFATAAFTVAGVVAGSAGWWFTVTTITAMIHHKIDATIMRRINHVSGVAVAAFGIVVLADLAFALF